MLSPFCCSETKGQEYKDESGRTRFEAVAMLKDCDHLSREKEFDAKLKRFHPELHLGFDMKKGRYVIYRWVRERTRLRGGPGYPNLAAHEPVLVIVHLLKWVTRTRNANGGTVYKSHFRDFGDWVFGHLEQFKPKQFELDGDWVFPTMRDIANKNEARAQAKFRGQVEDIVGDAMTLADRGNPEFIRTAVRVPEKHYEKAGSAA